MRLFKQRNLLGFVLVLSTVVVPKMYAQTSVSESSLRQNVIAQSKTYVQPNQLAQKAEFIPFTYLEPVNTVEENISTANDDASSNTLVFAFDNPSFNETNYSFQVSTLLSAARSYLGTPYRYGGVTRRGIDCSAFIQRSFESLGMEMPRISGEQAKTGKYIPKSNLQAGDLVFFSTTGRGRVSHVGLVVENINGNIKFIHAASSKGVSFATLNDTYWKGRYVQGRRIIAITNDDQIVTNRTIEDSLVHL